ncbi:HNH endonuclease [Yersinia enterocolitica]|nr:HNH endonuclease [Yersinia enterocolitica]ELI8442247.1 HNH endonuclease [Yersinia enterocolitica]
MDVSYAFDLKLVCGGYCYFSTYTLGAEPDSEGLEFRTPSIISNTGFIKAMQDMGQEYRIVQDASSFYEWTCIQGWALVEISFARDFIPHWLRKRKCLTSPFGSFTDINLISSSVRKRTFRGKFKKRILDRDNNTCVLCSNTKNLTLQHVIPYSKGGETSYRNLVTLCAECNQKLGAEYHRGLFHLAGLSGEIEISLLRGGKFDKAAFSRAVQFSGNIMHTRGDMY